MANYGIKVSKSGYSINSPDHKQILHSGFPLLKIAKQGTGTLVKESGDTSISVTIDHNLRYIPIVFVHGQTVTNESGDVSSTFKKWPFRETFFLHKFLVYDFEVTTTQLTITFEVPSETFQALEISLNYQYYICYDQAS